MAEAEQVRTNVQEFYSTINSYKDLATDACKPGIEDRRVQELVARVHPEVCAKFYGCGSPIPLALWGCTVLDLGCGTGRDCYVCSQLVGEEGGVIGVDMTEAQLEVAKEHEDWHARQFGFSRPNTRFTKSMIENLDDVPGGAVDVAISNCVVNLATDKQAVFDEVSRVLRRGGELYFSDVFCDRRLPSAVLSDKQALGECLAGAMYVRDFVHMLEAAGLVDPRIVECRRVQVGDARLRELLGDARFYSMTVRAFWFEEELEKTREDFGQTATYLGSVPDAAAAFSLDQDLTFPRDVATPVDGNTAYILTHSRLARHFNVTPRQEHRGPFRRGSGGWIAALDAADAAGASGGACCAGSGCCPTAPAPAEAPAPAPCCGPKEDKGACGGGSCC